MKVGITVDSAQPDLNAVLWSNGVGQNIGYLAMLLQRLVEVDELFLVTCPGAPSHPLGFLLGIPIMAQSDSVDQLDVIIELGARSITDFELKRLHKRGGKLVNYLAGNVMSQNFEEVASQTKHGDLVFLPGYDACWITPQHWKMNASYARLLYTPNTELAPHIWDPCFLRASSAQVGKNIFYRKPEGPWKIGIFDPSVHVIKTFHYPLMVAEEACRLRPDLIKAVLLFNAYRFREMPHLLSLFEVMDLGQQKKVTVEERFPIGHVIGIHVNAVVTHHWECNLSYLNWDTLYLGYPLIHNSEAIKDLGYYYPDFDPEAGGRALVEALETHDERRVADRPKILETLWGFSIDNPAVQKRYSELLASVWSPPAPKAKRSRSKS